MSKQLFLLRVSTSLSHVIIIISRKDKSLNKRLILLFIPRSLGREKRANKIVLQCYSDYFYWEFEKFVTCNYNFTSYSSLTRKRRALEQA